MIRRMCGVKLRDKLSCVELRQPLGIEDIMKVLVVHRNRSCCYGHVLAQDDDDWVKSVTSEAKGAKRRGWPRKMWKEIVDKDMDD